MYFKDGFVSGHQEDVALRNIGLGLFCCKAAEPAGAVRWPWLQGQGRPAPCTEESRRDRSPAARLRSPAARLQR